MDYHVTTSGNLNNGLFIPLNNTVYMVLSYNAYNSAIMPNNGLITDHNSYQFWCDREPVVTPIPDQLCECACMRARARARVLVCACVCRGGGALRVQSRAHARTHTHSNERSHARTHAHTSARTNARTHAHTKERAHTRRHARSSSCTKCSQGAGILCWGRYLTRFLWCACITYPMLQIL